MHQQHYHASEVLHNYKYVEYPRDEIKHRKSKHSTLVHAHVVKMSRSLYTGLPPKNIQG